MFTLTAFVSIAMPVSFPVLKYDVTDIEVCVFFCSLPFLLHLMCVRFIPGSPMEVVSDLLNGAWGFNCRNMM